MFPAMTYLDQRLRQTIHGYLESQSISGRRFGKEALGDPGFVASLKHGRRLMLNTADRLLKHMGLEPIGPAFEREVDIFLDAGCAKAYMLGEQAANDANFVARLRDEDSSFYLETVEKVHVWMWARAGKAAAAAMGEAISDAPFLKEIDVQAAKYAGQEAGRGGSREDDDCFLNCDEAAAYLGLSVRTLERYRENDTGPSYHRFGQRVLYTKPDLRKWAAKRRIDLDDPEDDPEDVPEDDPEDNDDRRKP